MMPDFRPRWVVMIGRMYYCGLGEALEGYRKTERILIGMIGSILRENAFEFSSLADARKCAEQTGGRVFRA